MEVACQVFFWSCDTDRTAKLRLAARHRPTELQTPQVHRMNKQPEITEHAVKSEWGQAWWPMLLIRTLRSKTWRFSQVQDRPVHITVSDQPGLHNEPAQSNLPRLSRKEVRVHAGKALGTRQQLGAPSLPKGHEDSTL